MQHQHLKYLQLKLWIYFILYILVLYKYWIKVSFWLRKEKKKMVIIKVALQQCIASWKYVA